MDEELKQHLTAKDTWLRGLFILVFGFLLAVARIVTWAVVILQFLFTLFTGRPNQNLLDFSASLAQYIYQCFTFITFHRDEKPFPFSDWPEPDLLITPGAQSPVPASQPKSPAKKATRKKASSKKTAAKPATEASPATDSPASTAEQPPEPPPEAPPRSE